MGLLDHRTYYRALQSHDTRLPIAEVALVSGFSSVRRSDDTFRNLFRRPPSSLGRKGVETPARDGVTLRLAHRPLYDWSAWRPWHAYVVQHLGMANLG